MNEQDIPAPLPGREDDGRNPDLFAAGAAIRRFAKDHGMAVRWHSGDVVDDGGFVFSSSAWLLDWRSDGLMRRVQVDFDGGLVVYSSAWKYDERAGLALGPRELPQRAYGLSPPLDVDMLVSTLDLARHDALQLSEADLQPIEL